MTDMKHDTLESLASELRALRQEVEQSDARMLLRATEIEQAHGDLIAECGYPSFDRWLAAIHLCEPARYRSFVAGLAKVGRERCLEIGAPATIAAARIAEPEHVAEYVEATSAWADQNDGLRPSEQTARHIARQVEPRREQPAALRTKSETERLRLRVAELESENNKLRRQLAKTERQLAEMRGRTKKAA